MANTSAQMTCRPSGPGRRQVLAQLPCEKHPMRNKHRFSTFCRTTVLASLMAGLIVAGSAITSEAKQAASEATTDIRPDFDPARVESFAGAFLAARTADFDRDYESAVILYTTTLSHDPTNIEVMQRLMVTRFLVGQFAEGLELADQLQDEPGIGRVTATALVANALKNGDLEAAKSYLSPGTATDLDRMTNGLLSAWIRFGEGDPDGAIAMVDDLEGPDWYAIFKAYHGASLAAAAGRIDEARTHFREALTDTVGGGAAPDTYIQAVLGLARLEARAGNRQAALDAIATGETFSPGYQPLAAYRHAIENGADLPEPITTAQQGAASVLFTVNSALSRQGTEEVVSVFLRFAHLLDPQHASTLLMLGNLSQTLERTDEAISFFSSVPETSPMRRNAELQLGLLLAEVGRFDEAKASLSQMIERDPGDIRSYLAYGSILSEAKEYREMADNYDRAIAIIGDIADRSHWNIFFQRGIAYERLKEWETAEPNFRKALDLYPDQPQVLNYLGYSWIDMGINLDEGMEMIEKAVALRPNDGYIVDSLGWAHYRLGEYEKAVSELERAIELRPADPVINDHLGDAYWQVGRRLEAVYQWNRALASEPEEGEVPKIEEKIRSGLPDNANPLPIGAEILEPAEPQTPAGEPANDGDRTDAAPLSPSGPNHAQTGTILPAVSFGASLN